MNYKNIYLIIAIFMLVNNIHLWSAERSSNLVSIDSIIDIKSNFAFQRQLNVIRAQNRGLYKNLLSYMIHSSDEKGQVNSAEIQEAITLALASLKPNPSTGLPTKILADDIINKTYFNDELNNLRTNAPQAYQHVIQEIEDNKDYLELINSSDAQRIIQEATQRLGQMPQAPQPSTSTSTRSSSTQPRPTTMLKIADIKNNPQLLEQMFPQEMDEFKTVATSDYAVRKADFINIELAEHANAHEGMISKKDIQEMLQNKIRSLELMFDYTIDSGASSTSNVTSTIPRSSSTQPRSTTMQQTTMLKIADIKNNPQLLEQMFPQEMDEFKKLFKDNYEVRKQINLIPAIEKRADSNGVIGKKDIQEVVQQQINGFKRALNLGPLNKKAGSTSTTTPITSRSSSTQPAPTASENTEIIHLNCYYDIITGAYNLGSLFPEENHYLYFSAKDEEDYNKLKNTIMSTIYAHKNYDSDANTIGYDVIKKIVWDHIYKDGSCPANCLKKI